MNVDDLQWQNAEELADALLAERDVMGFALVSALRRMEHDLDRSGWDKPGRLFVVYREFAPAEALPSGADGFMFAVAEVGHEILAEQDGAQIAQRLYRMAASKALRRLTPGNVFAAVIVSEVWVAPPMTRAEAETNVVPPSEHPRRVEARMAVAADRAGIGYVVLHTRGDNKTIAIRDDGDDAGVVGGALTEALHAFVEACT